MDAGIDYSHGLANFNPDTGIHFGVISAHKVPYWWDDTEPTNPPYECECGLVIVDPTDGDECECGNVVDLTFFEGVVHHYIDDDEYTAESDDNTDIWVYKSPYFTRCAFCSPCAPGAGYLTDVRDEGVKTYCLGHEWFDGPAPYPVYSVSTGELVPYKKED